MSRKIEIDLNKECDEEPNNNLHASRPCNSAPSNVNKESIEYIRGHLMDEGVIRSCRSAPNLIRDSAVVSAPSIDDEITESNSAILRAVDKERVNMPSEDETNGVDSAFSIISSTEVRGGLLSHQIYKIAAKLSPGTILNDLDEAYLIYCEYARLMGFSVKNRTQAYFQKTDIIRMKMFYCSCEGRTDNKASTFKIAAYRKQHCRTDCRARLRIVRDIKSPWIVSVFETVHNHTLLGPDNSYLLRLSRNLSLAKRSVLEQFNEVGIRVSSAFRFVQNNVGGPEKVGYIKKDAYDHMHRIKRVGKIGNADAEALMKYFQEKSANELEFFWRVHLDDEGRLMNLYFRDNKCAEDYRIFGDVVSVDTTFRTNKYNLICAPFVGMNHHRQTIMFGVGFLSDESAKSFEWLFSVFLESVGGFEPQIIFTDQDQAMKNGIDITFYRAAHRLCQWHINQNAPAHFGKLKNVKVFKDMWFECMNGCEDEEQFEHVWNTMVGMFDLQSNKWFTAMYNLRRRWADAFTRHRFSGGLHATSRSEGTNKVIKDMCAASTSLKEFVIYFERIIFDWRVREREEDARCLRGTPGQCVMGNRLLQEGAKIYTRNVYKIFERESVCSLNVEILEPPTELTRGYFLYRLKSAGSQRPRTVTYDQLSDEVICSCGMLISWGIFCKHILKVLYTLNVHTLPPKYVLKRWTKHAKNMRSGLRNMMAGADGNIDDMVFVHTLARKMYDKALELKDAKDRRESIIAKFEAFLDDLTATPSPKKKPKSNAASPKIAAGFCNPLSPTHPWLPPKRNESLFEGKRKPNSSRKKKDVWTKSTHA